MKKSNINQASLNESNKSSLLSKAVPENLKISKTLEPTGDVCIRFSEEELALLGIKEGDKFSIKEDGDGILLQKYQTIDISLEELSRENLEYLVKDSCEQDISVNKVIENIIEKMIGENKS